MKLKYGTESKEVKKMKKCPRCGGPLKTEKGPIDCLFCPECGWDDILTVEEWLKGAAVPERML